LLALRDSRDLLGAHGFDLGAEMGLSVPRASNIVPRRQQGAHPVGQTAKTRTPAKRSDFTAVRTDDLAAIPR